MEALRLDVQQVARIPPIGLDGSADSVELGRRFDYNTICGLKFELFFTSFVFIVIDQMFRVYWVPCTFRNHVAVLASLQHHITFETRNLQHTWTTAEYP